MKDYKTIQREIEDLYHSGCECMMRTGTDTQYAVIRHTLGFVNGENNNIVNLDAIIGTNTHQDGSAMQLSPAAVRRLRDATYDAVAALEWVLGMRGKKSMYNMPLTVNDLRSMDGEAVYIIVSGVEPLKMWALVEVGEGSIWLTNNLGGRTEFVTDDDLANDGITAYYRPPEDMAV